MDDYPESHSKRTKTTNGYSQSPNGYRSQSPDPMAANSTSYQLAERPASSVRQERGYDASRDDTPDEVIQSYYDLDPYAEAQEDRIPTPHSPLLKAIKPTSLHHKPRMVLYGHKKAISMVKFSPNGRLIASASADGTVRIWDAQTGKHEQTLEGHLAGISTISWSPDSKLIASGSDDKSIRLWDVATGKQHSKVLSGHHNSIYSLSFSPTGSILVSGSYDEAVFLWDVRTPRLMRSLPAHSDPVSGVDFCLDGTLIVSCAGDGLIRIWDTPTGQCLKTLVHEDMAPVTGVRFSPNGRFVAAWTLDGCVRLWRYGEGRCVKTYQGHRNEKYSLGGCFGIYRSVDWESQETGTTAASINLNQARAKRKEAERYAFITSGSEDGAILFWDVQTKEILQRIDAAHASAVLGVDAHPTLPLIASGGLDRTVRLWGMEDPPVGVGDVGVDSQHHDAVVVDLNDGFIELGDGNVASGVQINPPGGTVIETSGFPEMRGGLSNGDGHDVEVGDAG